MKKKLMPPINFLRVLLHDRCPHCVVSETEFYDIGRNSEESAKLREAGNVEPLWVCKICEEAKGHISCTLDNWRNCLLH